MFGPAVLTAVAYLAMAAVELPGLWGKRDRRGEMWAVLALLLLGFALAVPVASGWAPPSVYKAVEAIFRPIGEPLFKPKGG